MTMGNAAAISNFVNLTTAGDGLSPEAGTLPRAAIAIRDRLVPVPPSVTPVDVLPGIQAAQISALVNAITLYAGNVTAEDEQQNKNLRAHDAIEADLVTLAGLRHQVQLAAEQAFPWRTPGVAAIRQSFLLPTDRPLPN